MIASCDPLTLLSGGFTVEAETDQTDLEKVVPIHDGPTAQPNEWVARIMLGRTAALTVSVVCAVPWCIWGWAQKITTDSTYQRGLYTERGQIARVMAGIPFS